MRIVANSQWFLDPEHWEHLGNALLPPMVDGRSRLSAWSAGCATGKEPFSLAVLLAESQPELDWSILATDRDPTALALARRGGPFSEKDTEWIPQEWQHRHFEPGVPSYVRPQLRDRVEFRQHDLTADEFPSGFDVVLYRNMETCFSPEENLAVWRGFARALRPGGIVFVGAVDRVPPAAAQDFERLEMSFYRRTGHAG